MLFNLEEDAFRLAEPVEFSDAPNPWKDWIVQLKSLFECNQTSTEKKYNFNRRMQEPGESIDSYAVSLKEFGARCGFTAEDYSHRIIDQFILGIKDLATQNKLLQEPPKTIDEAVSVARRLEAANATIQTLTAKTEVLSIANHSADVLKVGGVSNASNLVSAKVCFKCNGWGHEPWQCPTPSNVNEFKSIKQTVCFHCQKPRHIARNCKLNRHNIRQNNQRFMPQPKCYNCGVAGHIAKFCISNQQPS